MYVNMCDCPCLEYYKLLPHFAYHERIISYINWNSPSIPQMDLSWNLISSSVTKVISKDVLRGPFPEKEKKTGLQVIHKPMVMAKP